MKNKITSLAVAFILLALGACNENKNTGTMAIADPQYPFEGDPLSMKYEKQIDSLIAKMTLEEKAGMLHGNSMFTTAGVERLGIPELKMTDGPLGIREELHRESWAPLGLENDFATFYPAGGGLSATWNPEMAHTFGNSIGAEARDRNKDVLLAPAFNIIRTPLGGRTFEYFTEDPFLNKKLVVPYVKGVQENDVAACIKHFAVNNQETNRGSVDVQMDERTLREIYLPAFKAAVEQGHAYSVMAAYNKFRGDYLNENEYMLEEILKGEWDFKGIVISDWDAVHSTVKALKNGADVEMGTNKPFNEYYFAQPLIDSVKAGKISEEEVNDHVRRVLRVMYNIHSIDSTNRAKGSRNTEAHLKDAYNIASESVILLKNSEDLLPLNLTNIKSVAIIGNNADRKFAQGGFGAGVKTKNEVTPLQALKEKLPAAISVKYSQGYEEKYLPSKNGQSYGRETLDTPNSKMIDEAVKTAKESDVAIIFAGSNRDYESEAADRKDLHLPFGQGELIQKVLEANPNTIVVMIAGGPFDLQKINDQTSTIVWSWFNGSEGGNALADILLGKVNPSGKLPWTMPKNLEDSPAHATHSFPGDESVNYKEGILTGYRWFDTKNIEPLYPFGYGLSYTHFNFRDLTVNKEDVFSPEDVIRLNVDVENTGKMAGKEVVQVYVSKENSKIERANQELKGFAKIMVPAGDRKTVTIDIPVKELAYFDEDTNSWKIEPGTYLLKVGNSSRNILLKTSIEIK
ncbi:glycosyl hydrolase [Christiangramia fulva]|uniref:Glycosyl hydrolase n=1 Tax=Christiangramia fulva TaxID=2126553 RepID=A0A2R3Z149_9FLAO|nr:glycoside hydrolase family 3 C-terminal domain-containing protein [Christiangramia fulva]AVR43990.1 glycosyl hydrolase [Christiangramia fulva]